MRNRRLSYLGTATIRQGDGRTEATAALYAQGELPNTRFGGRYWSLSPRIPLEPGDAVIRFHDATDASAFLTHVARDSGTFTLDGFPESLRGD